MRLLESIPRTAVALLVLPAAIALLSGLVILVALATRSDRKVHRVYLAFARTCLFVGGTKLELSGADHVKPGQAYVVVANHESNWDPPSIIAGLPGLILRFIVKREMMRIPIFGHALRVSGNVRVERNRTQADVERIRRRMQERPREVSMLFFAEGTRSRDGALHPFKKGAFATAISHGLPVLPIAVAGTRNIMTPDVLRLRRGPVLIQVGEPIPTDPLALHDRDQLRDQTHEAVAKLRAQAYQRLRDRGVPGPPDLGS